MAGSAAGLNVLYHGIVKIVPYHYVAVWDVESFFGNGSRKETVLLSLLELVDGQLLIFV